MILQKTVIQAIADANTAEQLQAIIREKVDALAENEVIVSASTGAAASYALKERNRLTDLIELYSAALEYKQTGHVETNSGAVSVAIFKQCL